MTVRPTLNPATFVLRAANGGISVHLARMFTTSALFAEGEPGDDIELAYFGILPQFTGRGIGGYLLTFAVNRAWEKNPLRVWLHTSSFDHPQALNHYLARGFRVVKRETCPKELPDQPPGPWPDAMRPRDVPGSDNGLG